MEEMDEDNAAVGTGKVRNTYELIQSIVIGKQLRNKYVFEIHQTNYIYQLILNKNSILSRVRFNETLIKVQSFKHRNNFS